MTPEEIDRHEHWALPMLARYFRLELSGAESIPDWEREPCIFVMNHTAIIGLEVYLFHAALHSLRPKARRPKTTVWPPFLEMPVIGGFYRAGGCIPMNVEGAVAALRAGESLLILPEGPDATDVRDEVGPFHAGFLRVVRALEGERAVPVVPLGWAGVDEANPWWITTHPTLVRILMKRFMPRFEFALIPRLPMLRPSKVVFVAGEPLRWNRGALDREEALRAEIGRVRGIIIDLVARARELRNKRIDENPREGLLHDLVGARHVKWARRGSERARAAPEPSPDQGAG